MFFNLLYLAAIAFASPWIAYRRVSQGRYRRGLDQKFLGLSSQQATHLRGGAGEVIWCHAVSVGEVNLIAGLVQRMRETRPQAAVVISSSTDAGFDLACQRFGESNVFFCPLDFTWAVRRTVENLRPDQLILAELELWPNLIRVCEKIGCPVTVVNARLSDRSARGYQRFAWLLAPTFRRLTSVGCQDAATAGRFGKCGTPAGRCVVTGSLKMDNVATDRMSTAVQTRRNWAGIDPWNTVWCAGSTAAGEEAMVLAIYQRLRERYTNLRLMIAPRHPERFDDVVDLIRKTGLIAVRRSAGKKDCQFGNQLDANEVILVDTIGELRHFWGLAGIATVGGTFGSRGGQSMIEPAGFGCAVSFGPDTRNFQVIAQSMIDAGGAVRVADEAGLERFVADCLDNPAAAEDRGRAAAEFIARHAGALERTLKLLGGRDAERRRAA